MERSRYEAKHWRYSSARDYEGIDGLIEVEKFWWIMLSYAFPPRTDGNTYESYGNKLDP
jgi:hypothetical protein